MNKKIMVLIAEDERPIANALSLKLSHEGFEVKTVYNGREALDSLEKENFNLLILDLMMPEVSGFEVLSKMKEKGIKVPVFISSNLSQTEDVNKTKELGAIDFFVKSDTPVSEIVSKIKKYFKLV